MLEERKMCKKALKERRGNMRERGEEGQGTKGTHKEETDTHRNMSEKGEEEQGQRE